MRLLLIFLFLHGVVCFSQDRQAQIRETLLNEPSFSQHFGANSGLYRTSAIKERLDSIVAVSSIPYRTTLSYTYDANGEFLSEQEKYFDIIANGWYYVSKTDYVNDNSGNRLSSTLYLADANNQWEANRKYTYTYDINNNRTQKLQQSWNSTSGQWVNDELIVYSYNANHQELERIYSTWNQGLGTWKFISKYESSYVSSLLVEKRRYEYGGGIWNLFYTDTYLYYPNGAIASTLNTVANSTTPVKDTFTYDVNVQRIKKETYIKNGNVWNFQGKTSYVYDANGNNIQKIDSIIAPNAVHNKYEYSYDSYDNLIAEKKYDWDNINNQWLGTTGLNYTFDNNFAPNDLLLPQWISDEINSELEYTTINMPHKLNLTQGTAFQNNVWATNANKDTYYYSPQNILAIYAPINQRLVTIVPNPSNGLIRIEMPFENALLEVLDMQGKVVHIQNIKQQESILLNDFAKGLYLYKVTSNDNIAYNGKIIFY